MKIKENSVVSMHYTLRDEDGEVIDSSEGLEPMAFLQGHGNIIPGLEEQMPGKEAGDKFQAVIQPEDAYGPSVPELIQEVPISAFEGVENVEAGMRFEAQTAQGAIPVVITAVVDGVATVDGNHELAGKVLSFDVSIEAVRDAEPEEIAHGHVH